MVDLLDYVKAYNPPDRVPQAYYWSWPDQRRGVRGWLARLLFGGWVVVANHRNTRGFFGFVWNTARRVRHADRRRRRDERTLAG